MLDQSCVTKCFRKIFLSYLPSVIKFMCPIVNNNHSCNGGHMSKIVCDTLINFNKLNHLLHPMSHVSFVDMIDLFLKLENIV